MAANANVWSAMDYVAPRGQCNHKASLMSPRCPCLRFMLHPLKSSSSYECDGCAHHASFHSMENKQEDAIRKRWEQEAAEKTERQQEVALRARPRKRLREIEHTATNAAPSQTRMLESGMLTPDEGELGGSAGSSRARSTGRGRGKKAGAVRATRAKEKVTEVHMDDDDDEYIELD